MSRQYTIKNPVATQQTIKVDKMFYNWTVTAKYFNGASEGTPAAGTIEVYGKIVGAGDFAIFNDSPMDATNIAAFCDAGAVLEEIKIVPVGITGVTDYQVTITGTEG